MDLFGLCGANYSKAVKALEDRFGRPDLLLQVYVRELLTIVISNVTNYEKLSLSQLHIQLQAHLRALSELKLSKADPATLWFLLVESCLSGETLKAWTRSEYYKKDSGALNSQKSRLDFLMDFIEAEVQSEQQIRLDQSGFQAPAPVRNEKQKRIVKFEDDIATAAGLLSQTKSSSKKCIFCKRSHHSDKCYAAMDKSLEEKKKILDANRGCYTCLKLGHLSRYCQKALKCANCGRRHCVILCPGKNPPVKPNSTVNQPMPTSSTDVNQNTAFVANNSIQCSSEVLLNTLKVFMDGGGDHVLKVRVVGDTGSQRTWIKTNTVQLSQAKKVGDKVIQSLLFV